MEELIPGDKIKLQNDEGDAFSDNIYIFYGYNHDRSKIAIFPDDTDTISISSNLLWISPDNVEYIYRDDVIIRNFTDSGNPISNILNKFINLFF